MRFFNLLRFYFNLTQPLLGQCKIKLRKVGELYGFI